MHSPYREMIGAFLSLFGVYWVLSAARVKSAKRVEPRTSGLLHSVLLIAGFALIWVKWLRVGILAERLVPQNIPIQAAGVVLVASGVIFAVWGRHVLGAEWSNRVEIKEQPSLIRTGPYAIVRNPIYTGVVLTMLGMALTLGEVGGLLGLVLVFASVSHKGWMEERFLLDEFGPAYADYRRKVRFLIPFIF